MLLVKTVLKKSKTHGIGLFAAEFIPKGTVTWKYSEEFDTSYPLNCIDRMPEHTMRRFLDWAYHDINRKKYILCFDDQRFINHSDNPNIQSTPDMDTAKKDIEKGEELTCNYEDYEKGWFKNRGIKKTSFKSTS